MRNMMVTMTLAALLMTLFGSAAIASGGGFCRTIDKDASVCE